MLLLLDNYDSFTYNLGQYFGELGAELVIKRNDEVSLEEIARLAPRHICISAGPGAPEEAGVCKEVVRHFGSRTPILGVCLGHQCIAEVYGGKVVRAARPVHGKSSVVMHQGASILAGLPSPFEAGRYHSLTVARAALPACLTETAASDDGEIMGLCHRSFPVHGVQFHPESILTPEGKRILANFLALAPA